MSVSSVKQQRGQFFTVDERVQKLMSSLLSDDNSRVKTALEPSAGSGHLVKVLEQKNDVIYSIDAVELDETLKRVCDNKIVNQDFFTFSAYKEEHYDVIIGNPPYVSWKKTEDETRTSAAHIKRRYSDKTNLYHLFIDRCIDLLSKDGEMVLIIPKEWLYTTSASPLREKIAKQGSITHYVDCGEEKLFPDADVPALVIIRFVKGESIEDSVSTADSLGDALDSQWESKKILSSGSRWMLIDEAQAEKAEEYVKLSEVFSVKVGIVSGADGIFRATEEKISKYHLEPETIKDYITTKGIEKFIDVNDYSSFKDIPENTRKYLLEHKSKLIERGIRAFDESNWWEYGAIRNKKAMDTQADWISVEARTRRAEPFKLRSEPSLFSGGMLGLYPVNEMSEKTLNTYADFFNSEDFKEIMRGMFIMNNNKISMQPSTLHDALIPDYREEDDKREELTLFNI